MKVDNGGGRSLPYLIASRTASTELNRFAAELAARIVTTVRLAHEIDVRHVLPAIRVPTLILHRTDDQAVSIVHSRYTSHPGIQIRLGF